MQHCKEEEWEQELAGTGAGTGAATGAGEIWESEKNRSRGNIRR